MQTEQGKAYRVGSPQGKRQFETSSRTEVIEAQRIVELKAKQHTPLLVTTRANASGLSEVRCRTPGSRTSSQLARLLAALQKLKKVHTLEVREHLGIPHVAGRIKQLRDAGHEIVTSWVRAADDAGEVHRVALYELLPRDSASEGVS